MWFAPVPAIAVRVRMELNLNQTESSPYMSVEEDSSGICLEETLFSDLDWDHLLPGKSSVEIDSSLPLKRKKPSPPIKQLWQSPQSLRIAPHQ